MRKHVYHVLTPLNRVENFRKLIALAKAEEFHWHVVVDDDQPFRVAGARNVHPIVCPTVGETFWARCNYSLNYLMDHMVMEPDDRYCFLNDDDAYEPGFFDKVDAVSGDVIAVSMMRGRQTPSGVATERAHGTNTLVAAPENMKVGHVGVEQLIISGKILKGCRLPIHICGDGQMIEYITSTNPTKYAPEAYVFFNYFEPGRWV